MYTLCLEQPREKCDLNIPDKRDLYTLVIKETCVVAIMLVWILMMMQDDNDVHLKCVNLLVFLKYLLFFLTRCHTEYLKFLNKSFFNDKIVTNKNMLHSSYGGNQILNQKVFCLCICSFLNFSKDM